MTYIKILFPVFLLLQSCPGLAHDPDTAKCWSATDKLEWKDFRGPVPKDMITSNRKAMCPSQIKVRSVSNAGSIQITIRVIFLNNQAWTKDTASLSTLAHEQLHFDITELHARKMRKSISDFKAKKIVDFNKYQTVVQKFMSETDGMQADYDRQTNHGIDEKRQKEWEDNIRKEMNSLKQFATTAKDCEINGP